MNNKSKTLILVALLTSGVFGVGCKQEPNGSSPSSENSDIDTPAHSKETVFFNQADISLVPDAEWQQRETGEFTDTQSICKPVLIGEGQNRGSVIRVFASEETSEAETAAAILEKNFESDPNTIKGTFKQDDFNAIHGFHVVQISYDYEHRNSVHTNKLTAHVYLFQNKKLNSIAINYITSAGQDAGRVSEMIRDTLELN